MSLLLVCEKVRILLASLVLTPSLRGFTSDSWSQRWDPLWPSVWATSITADKSYSQCFFPFMNGYHSHCISLSALLKKLEEHFVKYFYSMTPSANSGIANGSPALVQQGECRGKTKITPRRGLVLHVMATEKWSLLMFPDWFSEDFCQCPCH